jgi:hypothetical protein
MPYAALAFYVAWSLIAAVAGSSAGADALLVVELAAITILTADFASDARRLRAIVQVVLAGAIVTVALSALGLLLFYAGVHTSLIGPYGEQFVASGSYARAAAGFSSPPLLGSYCIFAAAVLAIEPSVARRTRLGTRIALGVVAFASLSRGALGFVAAAAIRVAAARRSPRARVAAAVVVTAMVLVIAALTLGRLELDPTRPDTVTYVLSDRGNRHEAVSSAFHTLRAHPLLGVGPGVLPGFGTFGQPFRAHLTPLNVAATAGIPALLALAAFVFGLWRARRRPTDIAVWSGLAGLGLDALAQDVEHFRHVWILLGLAAAATARREPVARTPK